ncbi:hypothetical protein ZHAS_00004269 [Anopheles sinensis]|uniref:Uncharacterized protein n=1 Tax=Anopheles sinensis TaxID=74873 RepID=A0A084VGI3_ANOSI|nr:hypothetical protein ZHAS_00004269 [Anopheles sinensis]
MARHRSPQPTAAVQLLAMILHHEQHDRKDSIDQVMRVPQSWLRSVTQHANHAISERSSAGPIAMKGQDYSHGLIAVLANRCISFVHVHSYVTSLDYLQHRIIDAFVQQVRCTDVCLFNVCIDLDLR